ncbi:MAG: hypothetical protein LRZ85_05890 [Alphaproteobacteria bacterium]|nr:hypothetical protein [Alphaproteobacteria bacterium]MCD8519851.1 hypothetical protein [Alphaproteobacteria bacterium]MCD8571035.1 hypothetical protein [Alphaproteobacteria bacterium]
MKQSQQAYRKSESGSALVYILIAIALLAALTVSFMQPSSQQTSSQSGFRTLTEIKGQIDTIRSGIQECVLRYPNGDQDTAINASDPNALKEYPLKPNSAYYSALPASSIPPTAGRLARDIRCPGKNDGTAKNHQPIFGGASGRFLPPAPDLFGEWQYYNGADGVFFWVGTDKSDAFLKTSMDKLDENFGACEADVVDNTASASAQNLDIAGTVQCPARNLCFRVWMVRRTTCP